MSPRTVHPRHSGFGLAGAVLSVLLATASAAFSQSTYTWTGGGSDNNWGTGGNWGGSAPSSLQSYLNFGGTTKLNANNNYTAGSGGFQIYFNSGAGAFTLSGNAINFYDYGGANPTIENDSTNLQTVTFQLNVYHYMNINASAGSMAFTGSSIFLNGNTFNVYGGSGQSVTIGDAIGDGGTLSYLNTSTVTTILAGANTYTGSTTINSGTLQVGNGGTTGTLGTGTVYVAAGATLGFARTDSPVITNTINLSSSNTNGDTYFSVASGDTATLSGTLTSSGSEFWKTGAGTLNVTTGVGSSLTSSNVVSGGVLSVADLSTSTLGSGNYFLTTGTLQYTGATTTSTRLGNYALQASTSGIAVTNSSTTLTLSQDLGGFAGGGLVKSGAGVLALTATNSYTGPTAVNAGTLLVNGSTNSGSAVTVNSTGTLGGTGTVNGTVGVASGGTINPGLVGTAGSTAAVGKLTTGALTLSSGSTAVFDLNSSSSYDKLVSTGTVTLGSATLAINVGTGTFTSGAVLDLVSSTGLSGTFSGITNGSTYTFGGQSFLATYTTTDFELTAVPEPATLWSGGLCAAVLLYRARRRLATGWGHLHARIAA